MSGKLKIFVIVLISVILLSCQDFFDPNQEIVLKEDQLFKEWNDFRSAEMGLYHIQQQLVDQIVVLGELRGDLLKITENADRDLIEVYNFDISKENRYASPLIFYNLIANCNNLIQKIVSKKPEVLNNKGAIDNYDRLYGEVQCMRAWAYFNAVRIYGKIPYIYPFLSSVEDIEKYVNTGRTFTDSIDIVYDIKGHYNDTLYNVVRQLDRIYLDMKAVIDTFTVVLENLRIVGVIHNAENNDKTWEVTGWSEYSYHCLLGQMYLYLGDYKKAMDHFNPILYNYDSETSEIKYGLDTRFQNDKWKNILTDIDPLEHLYTIWFDKNYRQQNGLQQLFSNTGVNDYMLKPTHVAVSLWECIWNNMQVIENPIYPEKTYVSYPGIPGDYYRGYGVSYLYYRNGISLTKDEVKDMLEMKRRENWEEVNRIMMGVDTVAHKFTLDRGVYERDAFLPVYRAAGIHLYAAEIYAMWEFDRGFGVINPDVNLSLEFLNNGQYNDNNKQLGVRGRLGFGDGYDAIRVGNYIYQYHPSTNQVTGWSDYTGNLFAKQRYLESKIIEERARELAFEGERFYDLIRIARRRGDPSFLADKVASKFEAGKEESIRSLLSDENNWYIHYYE